MPIWKHPVNLSVLNTMGKNTLSEHLSMEFVDAGDDYITARMPVDHRTHQPMGLLHGGASVALAETLGSIAAMLCIEDVAQYMPVGVEINANHISSAKSGWVYGTVRPFKVGRTLHVWHIEIKDEKEKLICVSRITIAIVQQR